MHRRSFLASLIAGTLVPTAWRTQVKAAAALAEPQPFAIERLQDRARQLATRDYLPSSDGLPRALTDLTYDQYRDIRFRPSQALWLNHAPFSVQLFHRGFFYKTPVRIFEVAHNQAREVRYSAALFDFGTNDFKPDKFGPELGFAGFRLHTALNKNDVLDELIAFLGASYFRAVGRHMNYGLSARGLAIATADEAGEEFPRFVEFYVERPSNSRSVIVHALLDSKSLTGAYTFTIRPGAATIMDVAVSLYTRTEVDRIGIAPLTSMFFFAANDRATVDDFRPEVHDSDGLMIWNGNGEWIWRPLVNPLRLRMSTFLDRNPKGFGLMQRNRDFTAYQDLEAHYETRPSVWVEPVGEWGEGSVVLVEIPTAEEINDNVVAFWRPKAALPAGTEWHGAYRLHWCRELNLMANRPASTQATRVGHGSGKNVRKFVVEFAGKTLPKRADPSIKPQVTTSRGELKNIVVLYNDLTARWRVVFELAAEGDDPIELRCLLTRDGHALTESWSYQWTE